MYIDTLDPPVFLLPQLKYIVYFFLAGGDSNGTKDDKENKQYIHVMQCYDMDVPKVLWWQYMYIMMMHRRYHVAILQHFT